MARNTLGTYTLPSGNPVVTDTTITSTWANTTLQDMGAEVTNSLDRAGRGGMTGQFKGSDGTQAVPGISFLNSLSTGFYRPTVDSLAAAVSGVKIWDWVSAANIFNIFKPTTITGAFNVTGLTTITGNTTIVGSLTSGAISAPLVVTTGSVTAGTAVVAPAVVTKSINGGQISGLRNLIINGSFRSATRPLANIGPNATGFSGLDRWKLEIGAGTGICAQDASSISFGGRSIRAGRQLVSLAPVPLNLGNYWMGFGTRLEQQDVRHIVGKQLTLSFIFLATGPSVAGDYSVSIRDYDGSTTTLSFVAKFTAVAGVAQKVIITTPVVPPGFISTLNPEQLGLFLSIGGVNTGTFQSTLPNLNSWQAGNFISAPGGVQWPSNGSNIINIAEVMLEVGTEATEFENIPIALERANCNRYYQRITGFATTTSLITYSFSVMRGTPAILWTNTTGSGVSFTILNTYGNPTSVVQNNPNSAFTEVLIQLDAEL